MKKCYDLGGLREKVVLVCAQYAMGYSSFPERFQELVFGTPSSLAGAHMMVDAFYPLT